MKFELTTLEHTKNPDIKWVLSELEKVKEQAIVLGDEERANSCWRESEALQLTLTYIEAFHKIMRREYREAWYDLERCEIKCNFIRRNSNEEFCLNKNIYFISHQVSNLQSLYPYCVFSSPGMVVGYYSCGICDHKIRPRSRCSHVKGQIYNGKLCVHVAHDIVLKEISIVTKPVQKYSVVHNDETLDFSVLEHLMAVLVEAFDEWDVIRTTKKFPIDMFSRVELDSDCPCKGGSKFGQCCSTKTEVEIPHLDFVFRRDIQNLPGVRFPY